MVDAKHFNDWAKEYNREYGSIPVVVSVFDVPGVKEVIEKYRDGKQPVVVVFDDEMPTARTESEVEMAIVQAVRQRHS